MHIRELPPSIPVAISAREEVIEAALQSIIRNHYPAFLYSGPIAGSSRSGRLFTVLEGPGLVATPNLNAFNAAHELVKLIPEARYDPTVRSGGIKGWEIRQATIGMRRAAIAWTVWLIR